MPPVAAAATTAAPTPGRWIQARLAPRLCHERRIIGEGDGATLERVVIGEHATDMDQPQQSP